MTDDSRPYFLQKLHPRPGKPGEYDTKVHVLASATEAKAYAVVALHDECAQLAATTEGGRNHRLNIAAFNLGQLVAGGHLPRDDAWHALHTTALSIGLTPTETGNTLRSGFRAGEDKPRNVPELHGADVPEPTVLHPVEANDQDEEDPADAIPRRFPRVNWHELWEAAEEEEWIVKPLIPARRLVALYSPPKVGKSLLLLELAVQVAQGEESLGYTPEEPRRVLYVDFENDPRGDVRTRLQTMGFGPDDLDNLVYLTFPPMAALDTVLGGLELLAVAQHYGCVLVVIDTVSRAVSGEENDNDTWLAFYRYTGKLLKAAEIACVRLDHTGKDTTKGMRGGSAKYGDVDVVWSLSRVTEDTYRLECTANRLPIDDKVLVIDRVTDPHLRHVRSGMTTGQVLNERDRELWALLDELGVELDAGRPTCEKALNAENVSYSPVALRDRVVPARRKAYRAAVDGRPATPPEAPLPGVTTFDE